jgi:hypothetical protein
MEFLRNNALQLLGLVFAAGIAYSELRALHHEVDTIEIRLGKKITKINKLEKRINDLEKCR